MSFHFRAIKRKGRRRRLPQSGCLRIHGIRRQTRNSERTADRSLSNKTPCTPTAARAPPASRAPAGEAREEPALAATAGRAGPRPRGSERDPSAGPTTLRDKGAAGRAPPAATGGRLSGQRQSDSADPTQEPRPDAPRSSGERSPPRVGAPSRAQGPRGPTLRGAERGRPDLRNPGRGRRRGSGATTRPPSLLGEEAPSGSGRRSTRGGPPGRRHGSVRRRPPSPTHSPASRNRPLPW